MICNVSAEMTHAKCSAVKGTKCGSCPGPGTEIITFDEVTYGVLSELADFEGLTVKDAVTRFISELAQGLRHRIDGI